MSQIWEPCPLCGEEPTYTENGGFCAECGGLHDVTEHRVLLHETLTGTMIRKGYGEPDEYIQQSQFESRKRKAKIKRLKAGGAKSDKVGWCS